VQRNRVALAAAVLWLWASGAFAFAFGARDEPFSLELAPAYGFSETDYTELDTVGAGATAYFVKVRPESEPVAEAAFVARTPSLGLRYDHASLGISVDEPGFQASIDADGPVYSMSLTTAYPTSPVALILNYAATELDGDVSGVWGIFPFQGTGKAEGDEWSAEVALYVWRRTAFGLGYGASEATVDLAAAGGPSNRVSEEDAAAYSLDFKHLAAVGNGRWVDLLATAEFVARENPAGGDDLENSEYSVLATLYADRYLGFRVGVGVNEGDDQSAEGTRASIGVTLNNGTRFGLGIDIQQFWADDEDQGEDATSGTVSFVFRF
jgi:hypothetical protein